jgi:hypothetical protein
MWGFVIVHGSITEAKSSGQHKPNAVKDQDRFGIGFVVKERVFGRSGRHKVSKRVELRLAKTRKRARLGQSCLKGEARTKQGEQ